MLISIQNSLYGYSQFQYVQLSGILIRIGRHQLHLHDIGMLSVKHKCVAASKSNQRPEPLSQEGIPIIELPVLAQLWHTCDVLATLLDAVGQVSHVVNMVLSAVVLLKQAKVRIRTKLGVPWQREVELNPVMLSSDHTPG